ncbi:MAG: hypothetical protein VYE15_03155, partial [Myxococcota bacterium]|nr:hypothetical protein [Myxococcota bacterium]
MEETPRSNGSLPAAEQWFHRLATHYVEAQALYHLNRVGVFQLLERRGALGVQEIASELGLVEDVLQTLMFYVAGVDRLLVCDEDGRYGFTEWGSRVLERYGRQTEDGPLFNFFDVRVGAYGPVWSGLDRFLTGEARYGHEIVRKGDVAADAVYKVSARLEPGLTEVVEALGVSRVMEFGVTTGLLSRLGSRFPELELVGLDRNAQELVKAEQLASSGGPSGIQWVEADLFDIDSWGSELRADGEPGLFFSVHFHEFLAVGLDRVEVWLQELRRRFPGWVVLAMEQPMLGDEVRDTITEAEWLYNHSNILIHHLIGNG